ncbi:MAG: amino acid adenylation domain-containing protein, partial [bacterium]|nr:amino acid adenylation domain-containing protein [bacterium]
HHIISDGVSMGLLVHDFAAFFEGNELPALRLQYKDYAEWENRGKEGETIKQQESFWIGEYGVREEIPVLDLPTDYLRPAVRGFEGGMLNFQVDGNDTRALRALALEQRATLYMVLLSIYNLFLYKLSGQDAIVVGTPTAGRRHADLEQIIGMFVNTLALKNHPSGGKTFNQFLKEVKEKTLNAFANQDYQYEALVEKVLDDRDAARNPLFDTMFILQNQVVPAMETPGLKLKPYQCGRDTSKFDLTLECFQLEQGLSCNVEYSTKLFKEETIQRFIRYLKQIVAIVLENPAKQISGMDILTAAEKKQLVLDFNDTAEECPTDKSIYRLFEDQVDRFPDHVALVFKEKAVTFLQFDESANQLAHFLSREIGIGPGQGVAVLMERSVELIVALMGVMKSGGAYVPLDPSLPKERLRLVFADASIGAAVSQEKFSPKLTELKGECRGFHSLFCLDAPGTGMGKHSFTRPGIPGTDHPAYIMYTSGSSGMPKGVLVEHRTIVNTLWWRKDFYGYNPGSVSLQNPPYFFDSSVTDIFTPLLGGARLVLIEENERMDLVALRKIITLNRVTHFIAVPAFYNVLLEEIGDSLSNVKIVCAAGEHFPDQLVKKHFSKLPGVRITNEYGPTENSVNTTIYELTPDSPKALIGKPIWNVGVTILDRDLCLCPIGVGGEICLSGASLARGYLNNPELTNQKFLEVQEPFFKKVLGPRREIFYRTGDMGRWLADGNLEFLGRVDTQVKIRGMRIEIGEIENRLLRHDDIKEAVVLAHESQAGEKYLCAYIVTHSAHSTEFREYLSQMLPDYMIPSYFVELDKIPLTPSGKIDRQALPVPDLQVKTEYAAPRDEIEKKLVHIWSEILALEEDKIGIDSNFFELGGHSLRATIVASRIHKAFSVNLPLAEIFKTPFISGLAKYITGARKDQYVALEPAEKKEYYVLSPAQKRLYLLQQMDLDNVVYNMPQAIPFTGEVDRERLEWTFLQLIHRHESLRTSFHMISGEPVQKIHEEVEFEIEFDCIGSPRRGVRPFDLACAPLLRGELLKEAEDKHILLIDLHHIVSDGTSQAVLKDEFNRLYHGNGAGADDLAPLRLQYKDYAQWQNNEQQQTRVKEQEDYWLKIFSDEVPVLDLPLDYPRPLVQSFEGNTVNFLLTPGQTRALNDLVNETNVTLFMALSAVFYILLSKLSGQEDIIVGTPTAGRRHADLESIIGMFVNTLPIRNYPAGEKGFKDFLREVKEQTLQAYENQEYPFEELVDKVNVRRDIGRNPVFDVMLNLMNQEEFTWDLAGFDEHKHQKGTAKFDLTLIAVDLGERLLCTVEYCTKLFEPSTIDRFNAYFRELLEGISVNPNAKLSELEIITETERQQILYEFNETGTEYSAHKTIHQLFEEQVARTPRNIAFIFEDKKLTYRELNNRSNRLAGLLRTRGKRPGTIVGIFA